MEHIEDLIKADGKNLRAYQYEDFNEDKEVDDIDELMIDYEPGGEDQSGVGEFDNMDWEQIDARRRKCLDDVPQQIKKARKDAPATFAPILATSRSEPNQVMFGKIARTEGTREKQLDAEIPWTAIDPEDREKFVEAEAKQWAEHLKYQAVRVLDHHETAWVRANIPKERILSSRYAYKDKNRPARRGQPGVEVKAKARLRVGGHRDPDLGRRELAIDAPTASKTSTMLATQLGVSKSWKASIDYVQAAFLNGEVAPRSLFFEQPVRGLPGIDKGLLIEIVKGVFGLSTSPRLWFEKLSKEVKNMRVEVGSDVLSVEESLIDPCVFLIVRNGQETCGVLEAHVDDLMLWTEEKFQSAVQAALSDMFLISEWEQDNFTYIGNEYAIANGGYIVKQEDYANNRLKFLDVPKGENADSFASPEMVADHRMAVGSLSWLAKETRPDLACAANMAQSVQKQPTVHDLKETNKAIKQAKDFAGHGLLFRKVPLDKLAIVVFHDAAWGNAISEDPGLEWEKGDMVASQIGYLIYLVHEDGLGKHPAEWSLLGWKSHACKRVCRSTFSGETMACCEGMEAGVSVRAQLLAMWHRKLYPENEAAQIIPVHAVTDCRSLYDYVHRLGAPKATADRRLIIDLATLMKPGGCGRSETEILSRALATQRQSHCIGCPASCSLATSLLNA